MISLNNSNSDLKESGNPADVDHLFKKNNEYPERYNVNQIWLKKLFKRYYFDYFSNIKMPEEIHSREFGFRQFDGKINRHLSFASLGELHAYILKLVPSDIYCSSSFYKKPYEEMDKKEWYGSELIFDIDGKDLNLKCAIEHNYTKCHVCSFINKGILKTCNNCSSSRLSVIDMPCKTCVFFLKEEVKKLKKLLIGDLGIDDKTISIYFSGNNGFHIHVFDEDYYELVSNERSELASYIMGKGFKLETLGIKVDSEKKNASLLKSKRLLDLGWRGRVLKYLKLNISTIKNNTVLTKYIEKLESSSNCSFQQIVSGAVEDLSVKLDPVVTMDIHRIFRLNGSLNSKSGLAKIFCSDIDSFNPFKDACFYGKSEVEIDSKIDSTIYFNGKKFVLNHGFNVIPEYLATYLISKGLVNINLKETK